MGHCIRALIIRKEHLIDAEWLRSFSRQPITIGCGLTLIMLTDSFLDDELAGIGLSEIALGRRLTNNGLFALIETDYFGGAGAQTASVYRGDAVLMPLETAAFGPINSALQLLGVKRAGSQDEFDTVGLGKFRSMDD